MTRRERNANSLQSYFDSGRFRKRLDEVRSLSSDPSDLKAFAISIVTKLELKTEHAESIYNYLLTGNRADKAATSSIQIIDKNALFKPSPDRGDIDLNDFGVWLELPEDTTQGDMLNFVENDWPRVKAALDNHYPGRRKRFVGKQRIDDYLTIADELNAIEESHKRARKAEDLAVEYDLETREIYAIAKKYKSILVE